MRNNSGEVTYEVTYCANCPNQNDFVGPVTHEASKITVELEEEYADMGFKFTDSTGGESKLFMAYPAKEKLGNPRHASVIRGVKTVIPTMIERMGLCNGPQTDSTGSRSCPALSATVFTSLVEKAINAPIRKRAQ